ncbi:MAG: poly-gamma-glutamate system protein, partial [Thermanaerothrix sp.]|nr:poly-gamma-glutamate system protein [Thermanaerothrix sp.]
ANRPEAPWPVMEDCLLRSRVLKRPALAYTLGGEGETGGGMPPEGLEVLLRSARGVPLWKDRVLQRKLRLVKARSPKLVVSIGGSAANLGDDPAILEVRSGLVMPRADGGNGLVGHVLRMGVPVLYLIDLKDLNRREGLSLGRSWVSAAGVLLFLAAMGFNRRFALLDEERPKGPASSKGGALSFVKREG